MFQSLLIRSPGRDNTACGGCLGGRQHNVWSVVQGPCRTAMFVGPAQPAAARKRPMLTGLAHPSAQSPVGGLAALRCIRKLNQIDAISRTTDPGYYDVLLHTTNSTWGLVLPGPLSRGVMGGSEQPGCSCLDETATVRLLLQVWGSHDMRRSAARLGDKAAPAPGQERLRVDLDYLMLSPPSCHRLPNFNLVSPHPFWGLGFPRTVCNKARAYLDCPAPLPCPALPFALCLVPCTHTLTHTYTHASDKLLLLALPSRRSFDFVYYSLHRHG